jgi:hypothetical protein
LRPFPVSQKSGALMRVSSSVRRDCSLGSQRNLRSSATRAFSAEGQVRGP